MEVLIVSEKLLIILLYFKMKAFLCLGKINSWQMIFFIFGSRAVLLAQRQILLDNEKNIKTKHLKIV